VRHYFVAAVRTQVGGGDQIYMDRVLNLPTLKPWLAVTDPQAREQLHQLHWLPCAYVHPYNSLKSIRI
jgi:hypothetical protein